MISWNNLDKLSAFGELSKKEKVSLKVIHPIIFRAINILIDRKEVEARVEV